MCGVFAYIGSNIATSKLVAGLEKLAYRGYDSAGLVVFNTEGAATVVKSARGKESVQDVRNEADGLIGTVGLAHTRWATHGGVTKTNAHPHSGSSGTVFVVHNGIIENYNELKVKLATDGIFPISETDTEILALAIEKEVLAGQTILEAVRLITKKLRGSSSVLIYSRNEPGKIIAFRIGTAGAIVIGRSNSDTLIASDLIAMHNYPNLSATYLDDGEIAIVEQGKVTFYNQSKGPIEKNFIVIPDNNYDFSLGNYPYYMEKEIFEQPDMVVATTSSRIDFDLKKLNLPEVKLTDKEINELCSLKFLGMGTSYHAALLSSIIAEQVLKLPASCDFSAEFCYREPCVPTNSLTLAITQSGETADTINAMHIIRKHRGLLAAVVEVNNTQATRLADFVLLIRAGSERSVAATKTFTATILTNLQLIYYLAYKKALISTAQLQEFILGVSSLPSQIEKIFSQKQQIKQVAEVVAQYGNLLYIGRVNNFPVALEGALKMKEVACIHAEGYSAAEMKHGVNALLGPKMATVAFATQNNTYEKMLSNLQEIKSRKGLLITIANEDDQQVKQISDHVIYVPKLAPHLEIITNTVVCQLLAYYTAIECKLDPDHPLNLAKTVTVE